MENDDVRRLSSACREASEDLFCVTGVLPAYDTLSALFSIHDEQTLLVLPGTFAVPERLLKEDLTTLFMRSGFPALRMCILSDGILAADVRLLADEHFRAYCETRHVSHFLIPFAELADEYEYGGKIAYSWIGEWRASLQYELRVTALFSIPLPDYSHFINRFASSCCTVVDISSALSVYAYQLDNVKKKYAYTLELSQRHVNSKTVMFFTDRREAEEFRRFLKKSGIDSFYVNGSLSAKELTKEMEGFQNRSGILIVTKSGLSSCLFFRADKAIFCGVPFSTAFLTRCASLSEENELTCCFCQKDIDTDINILKCFAENKSQEEQGAFLNAALEKLLGVKRLLTEPE